MGAARERPSTAELPPNSLSANVSCVPRVHGSRLRRQLQRAGAEALAESARREVVVAEVRAGSTCWPVEEEGRSWGSADCAQAAEQRLKEAEVKVEALQEEKIRLTVEVARLAETQA